MSLLSSVLFAYFTIAVLVQFGLLASINIEKVTVMFIMSRSDINGDEKTAILMNKESYDKVERRIKKEIYKGTFMLSINWPINLFKLIFRLPV